MSAMRIVLALLLVATACGKNTEPPPPSSGSPMSAPESGPSAKPKTPPADKPAATAIPEESRVTFESKCAMCHGSDGTGNGPAAATLDPKPRNYTDPAWQASVTDDELRAIIKFGGQAVGKSPMMPGNPQLKDKPEVIDGLVAIVRSFGKK
jgi:mono/diheme cytochrome c family protein